MNFYYDAIINLNEEECFNFYEWDSFDALELVKKIPLFKVDSNTLNDFYLYKIKIELEFLKLIKDKTILKNTKISKSIKYACILSDTKNTLVVEFDEEGNSLSLSNLLLEDDANINEFIYSYKKTNLKYEKIEKRKTNSLLRQEKLLKKVIALEVKTLIENNNALKLKYLFNEWFGYEEDDLNVIENKFLESLKNNVDFKMEYIYNLIKLSYNRV